MSEGTKPERLDLKEYRFFGCTVKVWKTDADCYASCPWRFSVQQDGGPEHGFHGLPNYGLTRHESMMRGWHRAKWIRFGKFEGKYK